eukprot:CAMPEP_0185252974 /NCGR_PEP_ID=MMETSP1359-20130426/1905_1 /TAXON_ID=552665 /ORGANISM="Bigelowiella longifila, Strain CCMP242" /LENGTH=110 /DNA_ID=CAMNT_0027835269 /DNA_START=112 /DNA_END=444 /DNA_ORIENTATION=+
MEFWRRCADREGNESETVKRKAFLRWNVAGFFGKNVRACQSGSAMKHLTSIRVSMFFHSSVQIEQDWMTILASSKFKKNQASKDTKLKNPKCQNTTKMNFVDSMSLQQTL